MKILPSLILSFTLIGLWSCSDSGSPVNNDCAGELDCADVCDGDAVDDACGTCGGSITDATQCDCFNGVVRDCADVCGGNAIEDECGECAGDNSSCVNYSTEIQPIFTANCSGCHIASTRNNLSLSNYANIMLGNSDNGPVIIAGDHTNSLLWQYVNSGTMPPSGELTSDQVNLIETWIDEGASEYPQNN